MTKMPTFRPVASWSKGSILASRSLNGVVRGVAVITVHAQAEEANGLAFVLFDSGLVRCDAGSVMDDAALEATSVCFALC